MTTANTGASAASIEPFSMASMASNRVRYNSRFFVQVGHETTCASSGNNYFSSISYLPKLLREPTKKGTFLENKVLNNTVNIYRYKTIEAIEANGNTGVIPTTSKSFSLYQELLQPL